MGWQGPFDAQEGFVFLSGSTGSSLTEGKLLFDPVGHGHAVPHVRLFAKCEPIAHRHRCRAGCWAGTDDSDDGTSLRAENKSVRGHVVLT
jgi:hypothetical protein